MDVQVSGVSLPAPLTRRQVACNAGYDELYHGETNPSRKAKRRTMTFVILDSLNLFGLEVANKFVGDSWENASTRYLRQA